MNIATLTADQITDLLHIADHDRADGYRLLPGFLDGEAALIAAGLVARHQVSGLTLTLDGCAAVDELRRAKVTA